MKSAIITGANGFIGYALTQYLSRKGIVVYAIVRDKRITKKLEGLRNVTVVECELSMYKDLNKYINANKIDVFYHFAWDGHTGECRNNYTLQLDNVNYTCNAIEAAKILNVEKFIFAGSLIEYEYKKAIGQNFYDVGLGNIYGIAKSTARYMGQVLAKNIGIQFISTTISNIYGVGEFSNRLFKNTLKKLMKGEKTSFTECKQLYDFIYIDDAIEAFYLVGENGKDNKEYYIGNKKPRMLKEFLCEIRDCVNKDTNLGFGELLFNGVSLEYNEFNTNSLYDEFNFKPRVSFKEGIIKTKEWLEKEGI